MASKLPSASCGNAVSVCNAMRSGAALKSEAEGTFEGQRRGEWKEACSAGQITADHDHQQKYASETRIAAFSRIR